MMSPLDIQILEDHDHERLDRLASTSPHGSVFSTSSWARYLDYPHYVIGGFRGSELVGGGVIPLAGDDVARYIGYTPWIGIVGRDASEGEHLALARGVAEYLLARHDEVTLTLPPEWIDIRPFTWLGMRAHIRYTYRGTGRNYEKRLRIRPAIIIADDPIDHGNWGLRTYRTGDSEVTAIYDWRTLYYWKANKGGNYHTECLDGMLKQAEESGRSFDMVGCNSPDRGLFKRAFGGTLIPYYAVTNSSALDLREPTIAGPEDLHALPDWTNTTSVASM